MRQMARNLGIAIVVTMMTLILLAFLYVRGLFWTEAVMLLLTMAIGLLLSDAWAFALAYLILAGLGLTCFLVDLSEAFSHLLLWEIVLSVLAGFLLRLVKEPNRYLPGLYTQKGRAGLSYRLLLRRMERQKVTDAQAFLLSWSGDGLGQVAYQQVLRRMQHFLDLVLSDRQQAYYLGQGRFLLLSSEGTENLVALYNRFWRQAFSAFVQQVDAGSSVPSLYFSSAHHWLSLKDSHDLADLPSLLKRLEEDLS